MGYHQILTIASIFILTILILNVHSGTTERITTAYSNEAVIAASGIAQSLIDEIQTKAFDEKTVYKMVTVTDSLTDILQLGKEAGETVSTQFNDIDDYNEYTRTDSLNRMGKFDTKVFVYYVDKNNPDSRSSVRTFSKRVDIHITNYSLPDTLKINHIIGY